MRPIWWTSLKPSIPDGAAFAVAAEASAPKPLYVHYDQAGFRPENETIPLEDPQLRASWGDRLYRIVMTAIKTLLRNGFSTRVTE